MLASSGDIISPETGGSNATHALEGHDTKAHYRLYGLLDLHGRLLQACFACISPFRAYITQIGFASAFVLIHLHA